MAEAPEIRIEHLMMLNRLEGGPIRRNDPTHWGDDLIARGFAVEDDDGGEYLRLSITQAGRDYLNQPLSATERDATVSGLGET